MSRKKRLFDIDMPDTVVEGPDAPATPPPAEPSKRRGPMASAIAENADALQQRRAAAEAIRAENDELAHEYVALRESGQVVETVPLAEVHTYLLVRDRLPGEDMELAELVTSVREIGLSNPIRVVPRPQGDGYELVQGYRRLAAYRVLHEEWQRDVEAEPGQGEEGATLSADKVDAGQGPWAAIPALVLPGARDVAGLYRTMVDENVVRKDLSFAEMAHAAQVYLADPSTDVEDLSEAVGTLFQSAPYSKRSYIRSFAHLLDTIGPALAYPSEVPRAIGVALSREIKAHPELARRIAAKLKGWENRSVDDELSVLRNYLGDGGESRAPEKPVAKAKPGRTRTKTTFHMASGSGQVKCTAAPGRLEIQADRDFSAIDRTRLEQAIASLIAGLG